MDKRKLITTIELVLKEFNTKGVDLNSEKNRKKISVEILDRISKKVYMINYASQETFE